MLGPNTDTIPHQNFPECVESPEYGMPPSDGRNNAHAQPPLSNYISHPKVYIHTTCITRAASHSVDFLWSVCGPSQVKPFLHPVTFLLTGHSVPQNLAQASVTPRLRRLISSVNQTIKHFDWLCKMCMLL